MATLVPQKDDVEHWTVEQVAAWLQQVELPECCDTFLRRGIDGHEFLQLSEEGLFLWGRDVSVRNRKQILKLVSQIKNLHQHPCTNRPSIDVYHGYVSQPHTTLTDDNEDFDDFSSDEDEDEENPVAQSGQDENVQDRHSPVRPRFPSPSFQQRKEAPFSISKTKPDIPAALPGVECEEDFYLNPIEPSSVTNHPSLPRKELHGVRQPLPFSSKLPWIITKQHIVPEPQGSGRSPMPPPGERAQRPLPDQFRTSQNKQTSSDSHFLPPRPTVVNRPPFQGRINNQSVVSENGRSGDVGGSFLHRSHQEKKPKPPPKISRTKESAWMPSIAKEKNDHVYETVGTPMTPCVGPEAPCSTAPDLDGQDLSSLLGAATISHKKLSSPLSRKHSGGGNDTSSVQLSTSGLPNHITHNRPPKVMAPHPLSKRSPQESQAPQFTPLPPKETHPYVTLDGGENILLTPLYQKIMEKSYFHLISRAKAKTLMVNGEDGTFLIRPSTRSGEPLTLTLQLDNRSYNINIRQRPDSYFALGTEKAQEKTFSSVDELISTHSREPIKLKNGKVVFLKNIPPKKSGIYVKHSVAGLGKKY